MKITTKYYYHNKGKFFECGGEMTLKKRHIVQLGKFLSEEERKQFYFDESLFNITCENEGQNYMVDINTIVIESIYNTSQKEYFIRLNGVQKQKLKWMFKRHWFQQSENKSQLLIFLAFLAVALFGLWYLTEKV